MHLRPWGAGICLWHVPEGSTTGDPSPGGARSPLWPGLGAPPPPRGAVKSRRVRAPGRRAPLVPTVTRPAPASVSASFPEKGSLPSRPRGRANQTRTRLRPREPAQGPTASPPRSQRHVEAGTHEGSEHLARTEPPATCSRRGDAGRGVSRIASSRVLLTLSSVASKPGSRGPVQHPCRVWGAYHTGAQISRFPPPTRPS